MAATIIELSDLDGADGFRLDGFVGAARISQSVSIVGDIDGDGFADVSTAGVYDNGDGANFIIFGAANGFAAAVALDALDAATGFAIANADGSDGALVGLGDVDADGFDDFLVGGERTDLSGAQSNEGGGRVVFGRSQAFGAAFDISALDGGAGFVINGATPGERLGASVGRAGDVNGDGFADVLLGGDDIAGGYGGGFLIFGDDALGSSLAVDVLDGANGFRFVGASANSATGYAIDGAGDINGDGFADLVIGASDAAAFAGEAFVVFGRADSFPASIDLAALDGGDGFHLPGLAQDAVTGRGVSAAGDVNGDGLADLVVGAYGADGYRGDVFVIFGKKTAFGATFDLAGLDGSDGFRLVGVDPEDFAGISVSEAGDFNGDGFDDVLIGATFADPGGVDRAGEAYVVFGRPGGFPASIALAALDATEGVQLNGIDPRDFAGRDLGGGGDVNGDGFDDIVIGARDADQPGTGLGGETYVVFGGDFAGVVTHQGTAAGERLVGDGQANVILLGQGADTSNAGAGDDVVRGGEGNDFIVLGGGDDRAFGGTGDDKIDGGPGDDMLYGESGDDVLTLGAGVGAAFGGAGDDVIQVSADDNQVGLRVHGGEGRLDTLQIIEPGLVALSLYEELTGVERVRLFPGNVYFGDDDVGRTVFGTSVAEAMFLSAGDDVVLAGAGGDLIRGQGGDDFLLGEAGDDRIEGGLGFNRLNGGAGADLFIVTPGVEHEVFQDFTIGEDKLDLSLFNISDVATQLAGNATDVGGAARIDLDSGERFTFLGLTVAELDNAMLLSPDEERESDAATIIELANLDGADGFRIDGPDIQDRLGDAVAAAGDFNGDGFDDVAVGTPRAADGEGGVFVVFGKAGGFSGAVDLGALDGSVGTEILSPENSIGFGTEIAGGDFNGDGVDDVFIGAFGLGASGPSTGGAFLAAGSSGFADPTLSLATLDGANGARIDGVDAFDRAGQDVAALGDFNGDGVDDFLLGAGSADIQPNGNEGESYVVFGRLGGLADQVDLANLDGSDGMTLSGSASQEVSGRSVADVGDLNGDGLADLAIAGEGAFNTGDVFVVFGRKDGVANLSLDSLDGADGFRFGGTAFKDYAGRSVAAAGDVNGDGFGDLVIGAYGSDVAAVLAGQAYVVFGTGSGFAPVLTPANLDGSNGFLIDGIDIRDKLGSGVDGVGDFNGDGFDDLLLLSREADFGSGADRGEAYVLFGRSDGFAGAVEVSALQATDGVRIRGEDAYGFQLAVDTAKGVGDVNGDGFDDLVLGAPFDDPGGVQNAGAAYVVFGGDFSGAVTHRGADAADTIVGTAAADVFSLGQGDDVFNAGGGDDVVRGGEGGDRGALGAGNDRAYGGAGDDVFNGGGGDDVMYGGAGGDRFVLGPGADTAHGEAGNDVVFARADELGAGDRLFAGEGLGDTLELLSTGALDLTALDAFVGFEFIKVAANQQITAVDGDFTWIGRAGSELYGLGAGNDLVRAGAGDDTLLGGGGDDVLLAQTGQDILRGGAGFDRLGGGGDADLFVFEPGGGLDVVFDYVDGVDRIDLTAFGFTDFATEVQPLFTTISGKAVIDFADGGRVVFNGVAATDFDSGDFDLTA